jgi:hypothetical protein
MLVTEYAKGNELAFRIESLKVYGVLMGLVGELSGIVGGV